MVAVAEDRPPYVKFEQRAVEDRALTIKNGRYTTKDVDFAFVTQIGSKDRLEIEAEPWFKMLEGEVSEGRFKAEWLDSYKRGFDNYKKGAEMPLDGMPVKMWTVPSPAQVRTLLDLGIRTVEDLAAGSEELVRNIGMGGIQLRQQARDWLQQATGASALTMQINSLREAQEALATRNESLENANKELHIQIEQLKAATTAKPATPAKAT